MDMGTYKKSFSHDWGPFQTGRLSEPWTFNSPFMVIDHKSTKMKSQKPKLIYPFLWNLLESSRHKYHLLFIDRFLY